jgi:hypothetical protein
VHVVVRVGPAPQDAALAMDLHADLGAWQQVRSVCRNALLGCVGLLLCFVWAAMLRWHIPMVPLAATSNFAST